MSAVLASVALIASALFGFSFIPTSPDSCTVAFLDVGQGDAIFIESTDGSQMLIDGGVNQSVLRELPKVMGPFDRSIDVVLATHPDQDHIGGLPFVLDRYQVSAIVGTQLRGPSSAYRAFREGSEAEQVPLVVATRGTVISLGADAQFEILYPDRPVSSLETNESSIVGKLTCGATTYMVTGDAPAWVERYLLSKDGERLKSDVLKAGHHGSKTSTAPEFVQMVDPDVAIISAGKDNRYGHPSDEVIETLLNNQIIIRSTAEEGTIIFHDTPK